MPLKNMLDSFKKENLPSGAYKKYLGRIFAVIVTAAVLTLFLITLRNENAIAAGDALSIGDGFLAQEKYVEAEQVYLGITEDGQLTDTAKQRLVHLYTVWANDYISSGSEPKTILPVLEKLHFYEPEDTEVLYVMASLNRKAGDYERSKELCLEILDKAPEDDRAIRYYADILIESGDRQTAADYYLEKYDSLGRSEYLTLSQSLYPAAPVFGTESGTYDEYFVLNVDYIPSEYSEMAAGKISASDVTILFTVDGSLPDVSLFASSSVNQTEVKTFVYSGGIDMQYYYNGSTLTVTAVAVDRYGMSSQPVTAEYTFNVQYRPVKSLKLSKTSVKLEENEQTALRVEISPSNATNQNVIWTSSNTNFATVDENGFVTAVKFTDNTDEDIRTREYATVYITATSVGDGISATCAVTVVPSRIPASTAYHYTKKYLTVDLTEYKLQNPHVVGYIKMDPVDRVPFLPDGLVLRSDADDGYYLDHNFDGTEDAYGEITVPAGVNLKSLGRNTVIISNYVNIELPEMQVELPPVMTDELHGEMNSPALDGNGQPIETDRPEDYKGKTLLTAVSNLNKHPEWYLDGKNHYIYFNTLDGAYIFQMFSWYHPDGSFNDYMKTEFDTLKEFIAFCEGAEEANQLYNTAAPSFSDEDHILTLVVYKNGEVDTVMHGRIARYKVLTPGVAPFFDDGLSKPQPATPVEKPEDSQPQPDIGEETEPDTPSQGEDPVQPEDPEVESEDPETVDPEQGEDLPSEGDEAPSEGGSGIEGDLNGDGYLSVYEQYQLAIKNGEVIEMPTDEGENTEDTENADEGDAE